MHNKRIKTLTTVLAFGLFFATFYSDIQAQNLHIDIIQATINGKGMFMMGADDVRALLGQPSGVEVNKVIAKVLGEKLAYDGKGLLFRFKGSPAKIVMLQICLSL